MNIRIEDISPMFFNFYEVSQDLDIEEKKRLWYEMYGNPNKKIFAHLQFVLSFGNKHYSIDKNLNACLERYPLFYSKIERLGNITTNITRACKMCSNAFKIKDINLNFIIMVGLFRANAFVTSFRDRTAFLFLEYMSPKDSLDILLTHEITHLFQDSQIKTSSYRMTLGDHIFSDGLATYASECLCPGFTLGEYLFVEGNYKKWILLADSKMKEIKKDILINIDTTDNKYFRKYFTGDNSLKNGIPTRVGYLIGYRVVKHLSKNYELHHMITWDKNRIKNEVRNTIIEII